MAVCKIKCEVVDIEGGRDKCAGSAVMKRGGVFILTQKTPDGLCAKSFSAIYPAAVAMSFSEAIPWEKGKGYLDITCPDGQVIFRLSRIRDEK